MTQPLSEEECRQIWDALDDFHYYGNGSYVDAAKKIDAVVASIADGRATGARLPIAAIVNAWGNAGLTSEKAMEQIAAVLGKPF